VAGNLNLILARRKKPRRPCESLATRGPVGFEGRTVFQEPAMNISDQIVLVTGGARGVGAAVAKAFAAQGARVVINWRASGDKAEALSAELGDRVIAIQADVADRSAVEAMIARAEGHFGGPVTTVINNALDYSFNGDARSMLADIGWAEMESQFSTVVRGALNVIQAAVPGMCRNREGRVVNIGTNLF
jgi:3-oxoacyl-[acyl-carrier protein] reductase